MSGFLSESDIKSTVFTSFFCLEKSMINDA